MIQQQQAVPTLKQLVDGLPSTRDIPLLTDDQAKEALLELRRLLDATVQAVKELHNWSLNLNYQATAVVKRLRLNDELHDQQVQGLTEMLEKICNLNREPFKALFDRAAEDSESVQQVAWHITDKMQNKGRHKLMQGLTTRVKNAVKRLDKLADDFNDLSDWIFKASLLYHGASLVLSENRGARPQWYVPGNQRNNPLIFPILL